MPASAFISSSATGSRIAAYAAVANEPPALGCGTTFTISAPGTASRSTISALLRCSQHWAAMNMPRGAKTLFRPSYSALPISGTDQLPTLWPVTSLVLQPMTTMFPFLR